MCSALLGAGSLRQHARPVRRKNKDVYDIMYTMESAGPHARAPSAESSQVLIIGEKAQIIGRGRKMGSLDCWYTLFLESRLINTKHMLVRPVTLSHHATLAALPSPPTPSDWHLTSDMSVPLFALHSRDVRHETRDKRHTHPNNQSNPPRSSAIRAFSRGPVIFSNRSTLMTNVPLPPVMLRRCLR